MQKDEGHVQSSLTLLPQVGRLLQLPDMEALCVQYPRPLVLRALREVTTTLRSEILALAINLESTEQAVTWIRERVLAAIQSLQRGDLRRVINGTGVVVHTNLGRSPMSARVLQRLQEVAAGYCNLEYNIEGRARGRRMAGVKELLCALTGAEDALVVNNCAAAVMLALATVAVGKEVILSRGELIEIGGSFRVPEVMQAAGVRLVEVGTTNRTHLRDYEFAIREQTALLLKVHCSNFVIKGFTKEVELPALVELGKRTSLPVMVDLGSGLLLDWKEAGVAVQSYDGSPVYEPTVQEIIKTGVDLVTWSGDKMLGGPQSGILLGTKQWVSRAAKHPIARALRADKLTLAALEATLQTYAEGVERVVAEIPIWQQLSLSLETLQERANQLLAQLPPDSGWQGEVVKSHATVGGGALPHTYVPSWRVRLFHPEYPAETLESLLRLGDPCVVGLLEDGRFLLDMRTLSTQDVEEVGRILQDMTKSMQRI